MDQDAYELGILDGLSYLQDVIERQGINGRTVDNLSDFLAREIEYAAGILRAQRARRLRAMLEEEL